MKSLSLSFFLLLKEYKYQYLFQLRQCLLLTIIFAIVIILFLLPMSYSYLRQAPFETADYDLKISGPLFESDINSIKADQSVEQYVGITAFTTYISSKSSGKRIIADILFVNDIINASTLMPTNKNLLIKGSFNIGKAVVSARIADELNINIEDYITIDWNSYKINSPPVTLKVGGILYETAYPRQVVADVTKESLNNVINEISEKTSHPQADYTSAYIKLSGSNSKPSILSNNPNIVLQWRKDALESEKEMVKALDTQSFKHVKIGSLLLYVFIFLWIIFQTIKRRNKYYAIICACGAPLKSIYLLLMLPHNDQKQLV
ncbi:hypothetical protein L9W92_18605 [Pelotomaculum terephthalicicum JT]|uniref:hypothetical protein n=1 Tax=Pelotomaculum terephthalicicum TaxID=206393 RepID=UPI001F037166|nr:hypothetical protein [Pelotomaculum terephthalicicum]MCG9969999.1 hypothetical protein [Pelotomaculum terephthalicicum JT]